MVSLSWCIAVFADRKPGCWSGRRADVGAAERATRPNAKGAAAGRSEASPTKSLIDRRDQTRAVYRGGVPSVPIRWRRIGLLAPLRAAAELARARLFAGDPGLRERVRRLDRRREANPTLRRYAVGVALGRRHDVMGERFEGLVICRSCGTAKRETRRRRSRAL